MKIFRRTPLEIKIHFWVCLSEQTKVLVIFFCETSQRRTRQFSKNFFSEFFFGVSYEKKFTRTFVRSLRGPQKCILISSSVLLKIPNSQPLLSSFFLKCCFCYTHVPGCFSWSIKTGSRPCKLRRMTKSCQNEKFWEIFENFSFWHNFS